MDRPVGLCPLDCPDACSLQVRLDGDRVAEVEGHPRNPVTDGFLCRKVRDLPRALYGPARLTVPLRRTGTKGAGRFEETSWDEALDLVAERLAAVRDRFGGEAILPLCYGGSNGLLSQDAADARLFRRLGASRLARTVCAAATGAALAGLYGKMPGVGYPDYEQARLVVVWGANPHASGIHLLPYLERALRKGARLVVIDPRRTRLARRADLHLPLRPGTDLPLALAVLHRLFESGRADAAFLAAHARGEEALRERARDWSVERAARVCGLEAGAIESFAALYADTRPALIRCGWGLERNRNGGSAVAAVLALPAVAGHFGVRGGGYTLSNTGAWNLDRDGAAAAPEAETRVVNMNRVGRVLCGEEGDPVRFLFVYNHNPSQTLPDQNRVVRGLAREDLFTVVFDSFATDTTRWADLVLPAAPFVERAEIARGYGAYCLQWAPPLAPAHGEARSNHEVFLELVRRLGLARPGDPESMEEMAAAWLRPIPGGFEELRREGILRPAFGDSPVQMEDVRPGTPDGRIDLFPAALDAEAPAGLYHYQEDPATGDRPLALISPASPHLISSTFGHVHRGPWPARMHPADAGIRGIADGDRVRIHNERGEVVCPVVLDADLRPGVVELAKGLWRHHTHNRSSANALCPDSLTDLGRGACFNDARVQVERAEPGQSSD
jgi:anaerobic selenocysteine-containing dehydrogenase